MGGGILGSMSFMVRFPLMGLVVSEVMSCICLNRDGPRLTAMKRD